MLRRVAEFLSRGVVLRRRLPARLGSATVFVSPDASLRFWLPGLERSDNLLDWAAELVSPGATVWDIGANVGVFAAAAAHQAGSTGSVLLVEPDPWLCGLLRRTIAAQPEGAPMRLITAAVTDHEGPVHLQLSARGRAANHLADVPGSTQAAGARGHVTVEGITLDGLLERESPPRLVKIDVEGSESAALRGATRLLRDVRPVVVCEVEEANRLEVGRILAQHHYELFDASIPPPERQPLPAPVWNTLAVPRTASQDAVS
jgi:FkbM family methyltransferase